MTVYAFLWVDCIYESGSSVVSLHKTKRGAFKAMTAEVNKRWQDDRDSSLMYGCGKKIIRLYSPLCDSRWYVKAFEVAE